MKELDENIGDIYAEIIDFENSILREMEQHVLGAADSLLKVANCCSSFQSENSTVIKIDLQLFKCPSKFILKMLKESCVFCVCEQATECVAMLDCLISMSFCALVSFNVLSHCSLGDYHRRRTDSRGRNFSMTPASTFAVVATHSK